jgi:hypothetical protein
LKKAWDSGFLSTNGAGGAVAEAVGNAARGLENLTQPSWWAKQIAGDPRDSIMKLVNENNAVYGNLINNITAREKALDTQLAGLESLKKQAEAHLKQI